MRADVDPCGAVRSTRYLRNGENVGSARTDAEHNREGNQPVREYVLHEQKPLQLLVCSELADVDRNGAIDPSHQQDDIDANPSATAY